MALVKACYKVLDDYLACIDDFRTKLRPGAAKLVDENASLMVDALLKVAVQTNPLDVKAVQALRDCARTIGNENMQQRASYALLGAAETDKISKLLAALSSPLRTRTEVANLHAALKETKNQVKKKEWMQSHVEGAFPKLLAAMARELCFGTVGLEVMEPYIGSCTLISEDEVWATSLGMPLSKLKASLDNLVSLAKDIAKMRSFVSTYGIARKSDGQAEARKALLALRAQVSVVQKRIVQDLTVEESMQACKEDMVALAKKVIEGGKSGDGSDLQGLLSILSSAAAELVDNNHARINSMMEALGAICGGDPKSANLWHDGMPENPSFVDTCKRAKTTILSSNGKKIDELSDGLKQALDDRKAGMRLLRDHINADEAREKTLDDAAMDKHRRAKTTKYECLLVKKLLGTGTLEAKQDSCRKYLGDHGRFTQQDSEVWIYTPVWVETKKLLERKE